MARMTQASIYALRALIEERRPDWSSQGIVGALYAVQRRKAQTTDLDTIANACWLAACDDTNDDPSCMASDGPHWQQAADQMAGNTTGRRWANRASRTVIVEAYEARAATDLAVHNAGIAAARAALKAAREQPAG